MDTLNQIALTLPWEDILEFLGASGILTAVFYPVYKVVRKYFEHHKGVMRFIVTLAGIGVGFYNYLITSDNPDLAVYKGLAVAFTSQAIYHVVKAIYIAIAKRVAIAVAFDAQVKSAALPTTGLPRATVLPGTEGEDFRR